MRIEVLGCSGGVGPGLRTTTLRLGETALLDAGTGVGDLTLPDMKALRDVFLSHSHLDHVAGLAFLADNIHDTADQPLRVHALPQTLQALREHLFNWQIWPDFTCLPSVERPALSFHPLEREIRIDDAWVSPVPAFHTVPATGYCIRTEGRRLVFTGDTYAHPPLWAALNEMPTLDHLIIEVAFGDEDAPLGCVSRHFTPALLGRELRQLHHSPRVWLTHHKPGREADIERECRQALADWDYSHLHRGDIIDL
jgi:Cft2 family RNA processing exonuclease